MHAAFKNMGDFFKQSKEFKSAIYFYEKSAEAINTTDDKNLHLITYLDLGLTHESLKNVESAINYHKKHLEIAIELELKEQQKVAHRNLIRTYKLQADALQEQGEYEKAIEVLEDCIIAGQKAHDLAGEGIAHQTMGNICTTLGNHSQSTYHYKKLSLKIVISNYT